MRALIVMAGAAALAGCSNGQAEGERIAASVLADVQEDGIEVFNRSGQSYEDCVWKINSIFHYAAREQFATGQHFLDYRGFHKIMTSDTQRFSAEGKPVETLEISCASPRAMDLKIRF
jgi:hypothetical protein